MNIELTNGGTALVDETDFDRVSMHRWRRIFGGANREVIGVATGSGAAAVLMHRLIMQAPEDVLVDHRSRDVLDNRRDNLRLCSHAQNMRNRKIHKNNQSGFKGVWKDERRGRKKVWRADIRVDGRRVALGSFSTPEQASDAYRSASAKYHGDFGRVE